MSVRIEYLKMIDTHILHIGSDKMFLSDKSAKILGQVIKEKKVYGINPNDVPESTNYDSDKDFMNEAERQGKVWSLKGFEQSFNTSEINSETIFIKII